MKKSHSIAMLLAVLPLGLGCILLCWPARGTLSQVSSERNEIMQFLDLLANLAAERYAAHSNRNETWVLTVHDGISVRKYTDGRYTVLSLPVSKADARGAICGYVNQYNSFNLKAADNLIVLGKYSEAMQLCRLIEHFGCRGSHANEEAKKRVVYLTALEEGKDRTAILNELRALYVDYRSPNDFARIDQSMPITVTNLLDIK
jgi:hypothetical protein